MCQVFSLQTLPEPLVPVAFIFAAAGLFCVETYPAPNIPDMDARIVQLAFNQSTQIVIFLLTLRFSQINSGIKNANNGKRLRKIAISDEMGYPLEPGNFLQCDLANNIQGLYDRVFGFPVGLLHRSVFSQALMPTWPACVSWIAGKPGPAARAE